MMVLNNKMKRYLNWTPKADMGDLGNLEFVKLGEGYFFKREVNDNLILVSNLLSKDAASDWAGHEKFANKIHLEAETNAPIAEAAAAGIDLARQLADKFKLTFPNQQAVFSLGCDEFGEFPSVTLSFYVKREGMLPLLPEDEAALDSFASALMIVL
jgi:hypothetical protein